MGRWAVPDLCCFSRTPQGPAEKSVFTVPQTSTSKTGNVCQPVARGSTQRRCRACPTKCAEGMCAFQASPPDLARDGRRRAVSGARGGVAGGLCLVAPVPGAGGRVGHVPRQQWVQWADRNPFTEEGALQVVMAKVTVRRRPSCLCSRPEYLWRPTVYQALRGWEGRMRRTGPDWQSHHPRADSSEPHLHHGPQCVHSTSLRKPRVGFV